MYVDHRLLTAMCHRDGFPFAVTIMIRPRLADEIASVRGVTQWLSDNDLAIQWRPHFLPNGDPPQVCVKKGHDDSTVFGFKDHRLATDFKLRFG